MNVVKSLPPIQFDLRANWDAKILPLFKSSPAVATAHETLVQTYIENINGHYRDGSIEEGYYSKNDIDRFIANAKQKNTDLDWLRDWFDNCDLRHLALAIAQALMPNEGWIYVDGEEHGVVTNSLRTIVIDFKLFDKVSALASLTYAQDPDQVPAHVH